MLVRTEYIMNEASIKKKTFREGLRGPWILGGESSAVDQGFQKQVAFCRETGQNAAIPHARAIPSRSHRPRRRRVRRPLEKYPTGGVLLEQQRRCARGKRRDDVFTISSCQPDWTVLTSSLTYIPLLFCIDCYSLRRSRARCTWSRTARRAGRDITSSYEPLVFITGPKKRRAPLEISSVWRLSTLIRFVILSHIPPRSFFSDCTSCILYPLYLKITDLLL